MHVFSQLGTVPPPCFHGFFEFISIVDDSRLNKLTQKVISFSCTLSHTGKNREAPMLLRNVVDQFLNQNGFTYTRTTKQTNFTSFCVWTQQVNHLDTCLQQFRSASKILTLRCISVNLV